MTSIIEGLELASSMIITSLKASINLPSAGWIRESLRVMSTGCKDTAGSAGARASNTKSVISAPAGICQFAVLS